MGTATSNGSENLERFYNKTGLRHRFFEPPHPFFCPVSFFSGIITSLWCSSFLHLSLFSTRFSVSLHKKKKRARGFLSCLSRTAKEVFSRAGGNFASELQRRHFVEPEPCSHWKRASPCWYKKTLSGNLCPLAQTVIHEHLILFWITPCPLFLFSSSSSQCRNGNWLLGWLYSMWLLLNQ